MVPAAPQDGVAQSACEPGKREKMHRNLSKQIYVAMLSGATLVHCSSDGPINPEGALVDASVVDALGNGGSDADADAATHANADADADANANANTNANTDCNSNSDTYTNTGADHAARAWLQSARPANGGPLLEWADLG